MVREERLEDVRAKARQNAEDRLLDILLPPRPVAPDEEPAAVRDAQQQTRERFREQLRAGRLDARIVEIDVREKAFPSFEIIAGSSVEEVDINLKDMLPGLFQGKTQEAQAEGARGARVPGDGGRAEADRHGQRRARGGRARRAGRHHLPRRDRQDRRARGIARPRRQPRRRAARHPADRRRHDGQHQVRDGAHRSHPVHRRRRLSRLEAVRSDSRAAGPLSDPRRARGAREGRVRADSHRAAQRADQAVHGADGHRRHRRCRSPTMRSARSPISRRR